MNKAKNRARNLAVEFLDFIRFKKYRQTHKTGTRNYRVG